MTEIIPASIPARLRKKDLELLTNLLVAGESHVVVREILDLTEEELAGILATEQFTKFVQNQRVEAVSNDVEVDDNWKRLEQKSLKRAIDLIDTTDSPEAAARVAAIANKTTKRRENAPALPGGASYERTVITMPQEALAARFAQMSNDQRRILDAAPRRAADVVGVKSVEEFMGAEDADTNG